MLRTRGSGVQDNWDLWINASVFANNTSVSSSTGVTTCLQEYERCAPRKSMAERPDVQTVNPEYLSQLSSVVFKSENHPRN